MADDEQFSLCWNNFNSNLSAGFHESLCRGDLVDVTLAAEGQFVKAHRLVLSVCSPYFRRMFTQMPANQHAFVFLKDVSHSALKDLIQFMYCGEVNVKQDALPAFISTAEALQIKGLTDGEPAPSQSPAKPSTPAPQSTIPAPTMTTTTTTTSPRARSSNQRNRSSYKLESEDSGDENKPTNQLVLSTQSQQHTLVQQLTQKRPAQRSITPHTTPIVKRIKNSDPLEGTEPTQITVQTVVDNKSNSGEAEFIDLPIDLPTKSEPDYTEDAGDVETAEQETTYVEDDSYGDMKYDESYFTENDETATAPTTSATVKQSASFSESYVSDTGDQATTEAQGPFEKKLVNIARINSLFYHNVLKELTDLKKYVRINKFNSNETDTLNMLPEMPVTTKDGLLQLETMLQSEPVLLQLKQKYNRTFCENYKKFIIEHLKNTAIDDVFQKFSWQGTADKVSMRYFNITKTLRDVTAKKYINVPLENIDLVIKRHLQYAKQRIENRKLRE